MRYVPMTIWVSAMEYFLFTNMNFDSTGAEFLIRVSGWTLAQILILSLCLRLTQDNGTQTS